MGRWALALRRPASLGFVGVTAASLANVPCLHFPRDKGTEFERLFVALIRPSLYGRWLLCFFAWLPEKDGCGAWLWRALLMVARSSNHAGKSYYAFVRGRVTRKCDKNDLRK